MRNYLEQSLLRGKPELLENFDVTVLFLLLVWSYNVQCIESLVLITKSRHERLFNEELGSIRG